MRFSLWTNVGNPWHDVLEAAHIADTGDWHRLYIADHFMPSGEEPADGPTMECWAVMAALASETGRVGLGTLVCGNTYRHPAVLMNQAVTTDVISGGRVALGLGAGWQENEHHAYGLHFGTLKERMDRYEEACQIVVGLRDNQRFSFDGEHYTLHEAPCDPRPVGGLPLLLGGKGKKRTLKMVARHADEWNAWSTPDVFAEHREVLDQHCEDAGRDPATIHKSTQALLFLAEDSATVDQFRDLDFGQPTLVGTPSEVVDRLGEYRDVGVEEFIVPDFTLGVGEKRREILSLFCEQVEPQLR